jgi:hypothetical protein
MDTKHKAVVFYELGKGLDGHYFYDSAFDSDYGKVYGVKGLTLPKALAILAAKGLNPVTNFKMNIAIYN